LMRCRARRASVTATTMSGPQHRINIEVKRAQACADYSYVPDGDQLRVGSAMLLGPQGTPYAGGFFFFKLTFPDTYPATPLLVHYYCLEPIKFHPNLYREGRVCLSILGTWSGPGWTPVLGLDTVLKSISAVMNDNPIVNEPAYSSYPITHPAAVQYAAAARAATVRSTLAYLRGNAAHAAPHRARMEAAFVAHGAAMRTALLADAAVPSRQQLAAELARELAARGVAV
jgi:ubiquitin-protein ligase